MVGRRALLVLAIAVAAVASTAAEAAELPEARPAAESPESKPSAGGPESRPAAATAKPARTDFFPRVRARWHMYRAYPTVLPGTEERIARMHHAFGGDVFVYHRYLRLALSAEGGFHRRLGNSDFILGGGGQVGVQYPGQFSPYFDLSFLFGLYGRRIFDESTLNFTFRPMLEVGVEFYPQPGVFLFAGLGHAWTFLFPGFVPSIVVRFGVGL